MNRFIDKVIKCLNCQQQFAWTTDEQEYYQRNRLPVPIRCPVCRATFEAAKKDKFRGKRENG